MRSLGNVHRLKVCEAPGTNTEAEHGLRPNRRRYPRLRIDLPIAFELEGQSMRLARALSYSQSGIFVATTMPPPQGTWVLLRLLLDGEVFDIEALVVRVERRLGLGRRPGFGAEFVSLPTRVKSGIVRLVVVRQTR
jgi:hypothetical protein